MAGNDTALSGPDLAAGVRESDVPERGALLGHANGESVLVARHDGRIVAVGASCPHYGAPLAEGLIIDGTIRCPWHHAAFDLGTGETIRPPARDDLPCWRVDVDNGVVRVGAKREGMRRRERAGRPGVPESVVIIGGGAAGTFAAETLRRDGYDGPVTLLEGGPDAPYDRPNLSKDYLAGTAPEDWIPLRPQSFYEEHGIHLVLGRRALSLDVAARQVQLDDGSSRPFGALLIATGATPVRLDFPDAGQPVHYLRTLADSRAIIAASRETTSAVVLGASFIGLEVAASLRTRGLPVTVVAPEWHPMERVLGPQLGDFLLGLHRDHGVDFRLGQTAASVARLRVTTSRHEQLRADLVVAGVGVRPDVQLAERAGLATDRGIVVDEYLETSAPGIYAAGDVARYPDPFTGERIRVEHWAVAQRQGQTAARNILGARQRFDAVPFFWSNHYDVSLRYVGHAERWDAIDVDGDLSRRDATVTYRHAGRALATVTIGRDEAALRAEHVMERELRERSHVEVPA